MTEADYVLKAEVPTLSCIECGNTRNFTVTFKESTLEIQYVTGRRPLVIEWTDTGKDIEVSCGECGSQDITIDDLFFE